MQPQEHFRLDDPLTTDIDGQPFENLGAPPQAVLSQPPFPALQGDGNNWTDTISPIPLPSSASQHPSFLAYSTYVNQSVREVASDGSDQLPLRNITTEPLNVTTLNSEMEHPEAPYLSNLDVRRAQQRSAASVNAYSTSEVESIVSVAGNDDAHSPDGSTVPVPAQQFLYYRNDSLYDANGNVVEPCWNTPEDQEIAEYEGEEILKRRIIIESDNTGSSRSKCHRSDDLQERNQERHDTAPSGLGHHQAYISNGVTTCETFSYETLTVFRPVICSLCAKPFPLQEDLDYHIQEKHTDKTKRIRKTRKQMKIKCMCGSEFVNAVNLRRHQNIWHCGRITDTCCVCRVGFTSRPRYVIHMREIHNEIPESEGEHVSADAYVVGRATKKRKLLLPQEIDWLVYRCLSPGCHKWGTNKGNMVRHIEIVHQEKRKFPCDICPEKFKTKNNMEIHRSSKHPETNIAVTKGLDVGRNRVLREDVQDEENVHLCT